MHRLLKSPRGFTLTELLVVIAIIGVLMGLLLPAVQSARESGRRVTCTSNQYQMALATSRFNESNGYLPGWKNRLVTSPSPGTSGTFYPSWTLMILPQLERSDIYKTWMATASGSALPATYVSVFTCPSSPPDAMTNPVLAYAGNAGSVGTTSWNKADGVILDTTISGTNGRISNDDISSSDGTAYTLLYSEKAGAGNSTNALIQGFWDIQIGISTTGTSANFYSNGTATYVTGTVGVAVSSYPEPVFGIIGSPLSKTINSGTNGAPGFWSQPSANHPGGVVVAFCDGHTGFLKDSLDSATYSQLLSSSHLSASPLSRTTWNANSKNPLSEGDFQ